MTTDSMPEVRSQDIGGAVLEYLFYPGDGPAVLLLHATGFQPWLWHPIARGLSGEYRLVAPYFCDHREFDPAEGGLSWQMLAEDLASFADSLRLDGPLCVGHSMGGTVCAIAEALGGLRAAGMVLIEPILLPPEFYALEMGVEQHPLASKAIRRRSEWSDRREARDYLLSKDLFANWDAEMLDLYLEQGMKSTADGSLTLACRPEREASLFMGGKARDPWPLLDSITCPVLLVEGEESENRSFVDLERAASLMADARVVTVPGAGHLIPMEKPLETLAIVRDFFESVSGLSA